MILETIVVGPMEVNCYVVACGDTGESVVIDPGDDAQAILAKLQERKLSLKWIVLTHAHFDHLGAARELQERTGAPVLLGRGDSITLDHIDDQAALFGMPPVPAPKETRFLDEGDIVTVGGLRLRVISTPGHSPGGISLYLEEEGVVFTGDTLFWGSVGRTDLPGCDHDAILDSLKGKLGALPDGTRVLPGHYDETTIGFEKEQNPFFE